MANASQIRSNSRALMGIGPYPPPPPPPQAVTAPAAVAPSYARLQPGRQDGAEDPGDGGRWVWRRLEHLQSNAAEGGPVVPSARQSLRTRSTGSFPAP